jgi:hypothetical protein
MITTNISEKGKWSRQPRGPPPTTSFDQHRRVLVVASHHSRLQASSLELSGIRLRVWHPSGDVGEKINIHGQCSVWPLRLFSFRRQQCSTSRGASLPLRQIVLPSEQHRPHSFPRRAPLLVGGLDQVRHPLQRRHHLLPLGATKYASSQVQSEVVNEL